MGRKARKARKSSIEKVDRSEHKEESNANKAADEYWKRRQNSQKMMNLKRQFDKRWKAIYAALVEFKQQHGDTRVPRNYVTDDGVSLGQWVMTQRREYSKRERGRRSRLTRERIQMLDDIDFEWRRRKGPEDGILFEI